MPARIRGSSTHRLARPSAEVLQAVPTGTQIAQAVSVDWRRLVSAMRGKRSVVVMVGLATRLAKVAAVVRRLALRRMGLTEPMPEPGLLVSAGLLPLAEGPGGMVVVAQGRTVPTETLPAGGPAEVRR